MLGTLDVVGFQWLEAEVDLSSVLATSIGLAGVVRVAVALAAGLVFLVATRGGRSERVGLVGLGILAGLGMAVDVANGHSAAATAPIVSSALQWIHVSAVGVWMGGLAALLVVLAGQPAAEGASRARRFSTWAGVALAVVAISGVVRAITEIGSLDALVTTDYGRVVVAKSVLLGVLALLGAGNRWFGIPRLLSGGGWLRWIGGAELVISLAVLALSALLVNLVPPASAGGIASPAPQPVIATGHDFGTSLKARLIVSPGTAGFNTFDLVATDFDTGQPVTATAASLRFEAASNSEVAPSTLNLTAGGAAGAFSGSGANLSPDGIWRVTATIATAGGAVEVPFVLATRVVPLPSDVNAAPGVPPITTVHLADGRSVQFYLDPGTAGKNDVHATFFDAAGTELPLQTATMALTSPVGEGDLLRPRLLEPGHFVASTTVVPGAIGLDIVAPDLSGSSIHVHATIEVTP
jgi:copper transport protein